MRIALSSICLYSRCYFLDIALEKQKEQRAHLTGLVDRLLQGWKLNWNQAQKSRFLGKHSMEK